MYEFKNNAQSITSESLQELITNKGFTRGVLYDVDSKKYAIGVTNEYVNLINTKYVSTINFGIIDDSVSDQTDKINEALNFCRIANTVLLFEKGTYIVSKELIATNVFISAHEAILMLNYPLDDTTRYAIRWDAERGIDYAVEAEAKEGDKKIIITNTVFLSSIEIGDLINIKSSKDFGTDGGKQGEIHKITAKAVDGVIFDDNLFDTYALADSPKICRITKTVGGVDGITIVNQNTDLTERINALSFEGISNPIVQNIVIRNTYQRGLVFSNCYAPTLNNFDISGTLRDAYGYGVNVASATMYANISNGLALAARHPIANGGGVNGVPWEVNVWNVRATIGNSTGGTCFDAHRSVGSIRYINCHAYGGYNSDGVLINQGFNLRCKNKIEIIDCSATNLLTGIGGTGIEDSKNIIIKNFKTFNVEQDIVINTSNLSNLYIDGLISRKDVLGLLYAVNISAEVSNVHIKNIDVINKQAIKYESVLLIDLNIENVFGKLKSDMSGSIAIQLACKNLNLKNISVCNYDEPVRVNSVIDTADIDIWAKNNLTYLARFEQSAGIVNLKGSIIEPRGICYALYFRENIDFASIQALAYSGDFNLFLSRTRSSKTYNALAVGVVSMRGTGLYAGDCISGQTDPAIIILKGSNKNILDCIVSSTPEEVVSAPSGAIARDKIAGDIYLKSSGYGNTGWIKLNH